MLRFTLFVALLTLSVQARPRSQVLEENLAASGGRPGYQIRANYPVFTDPGVSPRLGRACEQLLQADVQLFKQTYEQLSPGGLPWSYQARFKVEMESAELVSILYQVTARQDGAHPRQYFLTVAGSPRTGQIWKLPESRLKPIAAYCQADLKRQLQSDFGVEGSDQLARGTAPTRENYRAVLPTSAGLRVYFATEQIGPNLLGTRVVDVALNRSGR